jgi:hypothetical protein
MLVLALLMFFPITRQKVQMSEKQALLKTGLPERWFHKKYAIRQAYREKCKKWQTLFLTFFTSNIQEEQWPEFPGDPVSTAAILDIIFNHSVIVRIIGPSYRKHQEEMLQEKYRKLKENESQNTESGRRYEPKKRSEKRCRLKRSVTVYEFNEQ